MTFLLSLLLYIVWVCFGNFSATCYRQEWEQKMAFLEPKKPFMLAGTQDEKIAKVGGLTYLICSFFSPELDIDPDAYLISSSLNIFSLFMAIAVRLNRLKFVLVVFA